MKSRKAERQFASRVLISESSRQRSSWRISVAQVAISLNSSITFARLDATQTSRYLYTAPIFSAQHLPSAFVNRPHVFLLTSREPLRITLDSFTRSTTEVDFQAASDTLMQAWLEDLQYVCADPCGGQDASSMSSKRG